MEVFVSSKAGERLASRKPLHFETSEKGRTAVFKVDPAVIHQKIDGFGSSLMEAGLICLNDLPLATQEALLQGLFDSSKGAGFSVMKTSIAATDFASAGPWYSYNDTPGDLLMKNFSIARDLAPNGLVTFIKRARKYENFMLQATMDYPPDWMLTNATDPKKQDVNPKYFDSLALYYLRYLQEYQKQNIFINYLSPFNEPGIYTKIPYAKIRTFIRDYLGPRFQQEGIRTKIQFSESPDRESTKDYGIVLNDASARKYIGSLSYHGYDFKNFDLIQDLYQKYPNLPLWMTEICWAYEAGAPKNIMLPRYDWEDGDFWGNQIFSDLEAGASAWIYWNTILDEKGGPWATSPIHGNPDPNVQHPVVIVNRHTKQITYTALYYYLAHFSKWVRPGAIRIGSSGTVDGIRLMAFRTPGESFVVQLMNRNKTDRSTSFMWEGRILNLQLPALSITTCSWKK